MDTHRTDLIRKNLWNFHKKCSIFGLKNKKCIDLNIIGDYDGEHIGVAFYDEKKYLMSILLF